MVDKGIIFVEKNLIEDKEASLDLESAFLVRFQESLTSTGYHSGNEVED